MREALVRTPNPASRPRARLPSHLAAVLPSFHPIDCIGDSFSSLHPPLSQNEIDWMGDSFSPSHRLADKYYWAHAPELVAPADSLSWPDFIRRRDAAGARDADVARDAEMALAPGTRRTTRAPEGLPPHWQLGDLKARAGTRAPARVLANGAWC